MAKNNKSGLGLNMLIAKSHQVSAQLVGVQLSIANLLAIAVSAASIVAGTVTVTIQKYPDNWLLAVVAGIIGIGLAVLIEGMTLGGLIRIRLASKKIKSIDDEIEKERDKIDWLTYSKQERKTKEKELKWKWARATKRFRKMRTWSVPIVVVGSVSSAVAGGMFYHTVLAGLGNWESIGVSALFPFVVTCTFVSSELFKDIQEEAIREGYSGGGLADAALREETRRLSFQAVHNGILHHFNDEEIQQELKAGTLAMLKDIIVDLRETVSGPVVAELPDGSVDGTITTISEVPSAEQLVEVPMEVSGGSEGSSDGSPILPKEEVQKDPPKPKKSSVKRKLTRGELLTIAEAAASLECTPRHVRNLRKSGSIESDSSGLLIAASVHEYLATRRKPEPKPQDTDPIPVQNGHSDVHLLDNLVELEVP